MNAPHPFRAQHGHLLTVAPSLDEIPALAPAYDRAHADGELGTALTMLDQAVSALVMGSWHLDRATGKGAGSDLDLTMLERLNGRVAEIHQKMELSAGRIIAKQAGAR